MQIYKVSVSVLVCFTGKLNLKGVLVSTVQAPGLAYQVFVPVLVEVLGLSIRDD